MDLSLAIHTLQVEKKPLLSLLSIEGSLPSEKGIGDQQMMPELLNEEFLAKSTRVQFRRHKESYNTVLETYKQGTYIAGSVVIDTLTHKTTTVPLTHALRVSYL